MSQPSPRVSIGMGVYNGANFITEAIESILAQTFTDFELIISDNASTDETESICRRFAARDGRIRYLRNPQNLGAAMNHNRIVGLVRGEYVKWASHDDVLEPAFLQRCVEVLDSRPDVVLCHTRTRIIDADSRAVKDLTEKLVVDANLPHRRYRQFFAFYRNPQECNDVFGLVRRSVLGQTGLFGTYPASDMILLGEYALHGRFAQVPEYLFLRRDHPGTSVRANPAWEQRAVWFDPRNRGKVQLVFLRWTKEYLANVARAPVSTAERLRCATEALRWSAWQRRRLASELLLAPLWVYRLIRPAEKPLS